MLKRRKIFYGWWVVIALFVVGTLGPLARNCMAAFFPFIASELEWSRSTIGLAQSLTMWMYAFFVLLSGRMTDRIGSQKTILIGSLFCLGGWLLLSTVSSLWQLYFYYGTIMALAVSMTHFVPLQATARKWFIKRAGLATGIIVSAHSVGVSIFIPLLTTMSSTLGWRNTSMICAFAFSIAIMLVALLIIRNTPESVGLHPDNEQPASTSNNSQGVIEECWTVREAIKTPQLWLLLTVYGISGIPWQGLLSHLVMWGVDLGSTMAAAGVFLTAMMIPSIISGVGGGWLGDRYNKQRIIAIGYLSCVLIMLWGWQGIHTGQHLIIFALFMGIGSGLPIGLYTPILGDLFGRANVGSLFGILTMGHSLIGGFGPLLWGKLFEISGSYNPVCVVSAGCYAIAVLAACLIRPIAKTS
ncbi:L-lactate transporter [subsurface metagenome]